MLKKTSRVLVPVVAASVMTILAACGWFFHRGQQTLLDLINHTSQKTTDVYSRWLELDPAQPVSRDYVVQWLELLNYQPAYGSLSVPGQYVLHADDLDIAARGFTFSDKTQPPQVIHLAFTSSGLSAVESLPDHQKLSGWRLEPVRLAQWSAKGGAAQPQIRLADLPAYVPGAIIAMEDKRFFHHGAFDVLGLMRAVWIDLHRGHLKQGGSTISQQLARSIFLSVERTFTRKLLEAGLAFFLEARYSKEQLLEMYLNQVYWGQDGSESLIGLESASRSYFGASARDLTLGESAMLAGLLQSPNHFSPRASMHIALSRRNRVLALMVAQGMITQEDFQAAVKEPIALAPSRGKSNLAPYFLSSLQDVLAQNYSLNVLLTQGWKVYTTLDPVLQRWANQAAHPSEGQAAMVALDPRNGAIRVWVGGTDYGKSSYDRVVYAHRQPGSAFKPFVVLAALDSHKATMATLLDNTPLTVKTPQGPWTPQNYDRKYGTKVSLWDTLVLSLNVPTVRLALLTGLPKVMDYARHVGIQTPLREVPSLALGTSEVSVLELTSAYGTLANAGRSSLPYSIESIVDADGHLSQWNVSSTHDAVSPGSAFLVTRMLEAVFDEGTAKHAKDLGFTFTAAGKTGTSENYQDAWFVGYVPNLACGVWVGYDRPQMMGRAAAGIALPVWVAFMQKALTLVPPQPFEEPKDILWKMVDPVSGMLARSGCPTRRKEAFLPGTLPEECTLHPGGIKGFFQRWRKK